LDHADIVRLQAQRVGGDAGEHGLDALADFRIGGADFHHSALMRADLDLAGQVDLARAGEAAAVHERRQADAAPQRQPAPFLVGVEQLVGLALFGPIDCVQRPIQPGRQIDRLRDHLAGG
jgi:hypothetical protein